MIKTDQLLSILKQINNNIQFILEESQTRLPFLDLMIKTGAKIWVDIYSRSTGSRQIVPFTLNHPRNCLANILFSLEKRIYTIFEDGNAKEKCFKELKKKRSLEQKYYKLLIEASILKVKNTSLSFKAN